jgi:electron transfer flavoprotein beta subunit
VDTGVEERRVRLPAIATVDLRIIGKKSVRNLALSGPEVEWEDTQRLASLKGIMAAKKKELKEITAESLGVSGGILVKTLRHENPPSRKAGIKVASVEELVSKLHTEAKVI